MVSYFLNNAAETYLYRLKISENIETELAFHCRAFFISVAISTQVTYLSALKRRHFLQVFQNFVFVWAIFRYSSIKFLQHWNNLCEGVIMNKCMLNTCSLHYLLLWNKQHMSCLFFKIIVGSLIYFLISSTNIYILKQSWCQCKNSVLYCQFFLMYYVIVFLQKTISFIRTKIPLWRITCSVGS